VVAGGTQPAAPVATTTAPALETLSTPQEAHMRALALLRPRAKDTVFAGRDLDHIDFESQWHELESAVFSLVEKARRAGDISTQLDASALTTDLLYEFTALGPVEHLLADESVDEIFVDGFNRISTRKGKELVPVADRGFSSADAYDDIVERLVRTRATMARIDSPLATGRLEDGTWFQVVRRTLAPQGPLLHLVKARHEPQRLEDWVVEGRISERHAAELKRRTVDGRANTLVVSPSPDAAAAVVEAIVAALAPTERFALLEQRPRIALSFGAPAVRFDGAQAESVEAAHLSGAARLVAVDVAPATLARLLSHGATRADGIVASLRARGAEDVPARIRATHETGTPKEAALALAGAALD
jgi:pilus assembly protein CpaF